MVKKSPKRPLAIVTGASTGIGYELARCCAQDGFDLIVAADQPEIEEAGEDFRAFGGKVDALETDLATIEGVEELYAATKGRSVDALLANAGRGLGRGFLDQSFNDECSDRYEYHRDDLSYPKGRRGICVSESREEF